MSFDHLSNLPEWNDDEFEDDVEEGEGWKQQPTKQACKAMYLQWQQVMILLNGAFDTMKLPLEGEENVFPADYWEDHKQMLLGDGYEVAVKMKSSEAGLYMIRMENACIIRKNAQYIYSALLTMSIENIIEETYITAIRLEIDKFRELFKEWVQTFEKDEFEDDWGLFN